jgi:chromosome segregation ATPase
LWNLDSDKKKNQNQSSNNAPKTGSDKFSKDGVSKVTSIEELDSMMSNEGDRFMDAFKDELADGNEKENSAAFTKIESSFDFNESKNNDDEDNWGQSKIIEERKNDPEDIKTIKRYAALKEREAREKQASLAVLRKEYDKLFEKLKKSDEERRRVQLHSQELELQLRTAGDKRDEVQHQWSRMEGQLQESIKELQIRLDSAQYQASKAEKKLEDFRERVKNDIQKIRTRERELANRLEIQKRDAEALIVAKDERLLQQKREIDRLSFEMESLRERLFEESEKSDDRAKRIARVIQSLKLAQGLLSSLENAPAANNSENNDNTSDDKKGEAA